MYLKIVLGSVKAPTVHTFGFREKFTCNSGACCSMTSGFWRTVPLETSAGCMCVCVSQGPKNLCMYS